MKVFFAGMVLAMMSSAFALDAPPQAANAPVGNVPGAASIVLTPLAPVGVAEKSAWISTAIGQNLLNELSRSRLIHPVLHVEKLPAATAEQAKKAAAASGAAYVLFGSYEMAEGNLRITGQVLEVRTGKYIGGIKATGTMRDLFLMEDTLSEQLKRIMQEAVNPREAMVKVAPAGGGNAPAAQPFAPVPFNGRLRDDGHIFPWERDNEVIEQAKWRLDNGGGYDRLYYPFDGYAFYGWSWYPVSYCGPRYYYNYNHCYGGYYSGISFSASYTGRHGYVNVSAPAHQPYYPMRSGGGMRR